MDMYQKRKMRQEKKLEGNQEKLTKVGINWYIDTYSKITSNSYKTRILV